MAEQSVQGLAERERPERLDARRPRVIYVMGAGHSGSTILGVTLGNCDGVFYAGEVEEWLVTSGQTPIGGSERTDFWRRVGAGVRGAEPIFGAQANRCIERSSSVFRAGRWRARRRLREPYRRVAEDLLRSIAATSAADTVVDTSHFPLRARELKALRGIDLFLVFLAREPQSVVSSELREIHRHRVGERRIRMLASNANLWLTHLLSVIVFLGHPRARRLFVRHEDFLADPPAVTRRILDLVGSSAQLPDFTELRTGFPLMANQLISSEYVALRDAGGPPARILLLTAVLQAPWKAVLKRLTPSAGASSAHDANAGSPARSQ